MSTPSGPAPQPDPSRLRIGDAERTSALDALGEHLSSGRLSLDEYGDRSAQVTQARTVAELRILFDDLPPPHPALPDAAPAIPPPSDVRRASRSAPATQDPRPPAQRAAGAILAISGILSVLLFFWLKTWVVFLLPAVIAVISGAVWGGQGGRDNGR